MLMISSNESRLRKLINRKQHFFVYFIFV